MMIVREPLLPPTSAIKRVLGVDDPADLRRLQIKFKARRDGLLADARRLLAEAQAEEQAARVKAFLTGVHDLRLGAAFGLATLVSSPEVKNSIFALGAAVARIHKALDTPEFTAMAARMGYLAGLVKTTGVNPIFLSGQPPRLRVRRLMKS